MSRPHMETAREGDTSGASSAYETIDKRVFASHGFPLSARSWCTIATGLQLSERELQVIQGVFDGRSEAAIAQRLHLSAHTIHSHLCRIYRKLDVTSRAALTLRVFAEYLAHSDDAHIVLQGTSDRSTLSTANQRVRPTLHHPGTAAGCVA